MASSSRAVLVAGALLASASLAQAGDRGAFAAVSPDERVDLRPIEKPAPASVPAAAPVAETARSGRDRASHHRTRLARRAAKAVATAALKATFPTAPADAAPPATGSAMAASPQVQSAETVAAAEPLVDAADAARGRTETAAATPPAVAAIGGPREAPSGTVSDLLAKHARLNGVPLKLAQAVVAIESRGNVRASHAGALGLMQIKYGTARAAGFSGPAVGLFAADTNLRFGMKILGEAYRAAGGDTCGALMRYQSGHLATHMNSANRAYCSRARSLMAGA